MNFLLEMLMKKYQTKQKTILNGSFTKQGSVLNGQEDSPEFLFQTNARIKKVLVTFYDGQEAEMSVHLSTTDSLNHRFNMTHNALVGNDQTIPIVMDVDVTNGTTMVIDVKNNSEVESTYSYSITVEYEYEV